MVTRRTFVYNSCDSTLSNCSAKHMLVHFVLKLQEFSQVSRYTMLQYYNWILSYPLLSVSSIKGMATSVL